MPAHSHRARVATLVILALALSTVSARAQCHPEFAPYIGYGSGYTHSAAAADLNADGWPEAVIMDTDGVIQIHWNSGPGGGGSFQGSTDLLTGWTFSRYVAFGDFNSDGRVDIAAPSNNSIAVFFAASAPDPIGTFLSPVLLGVGGAVGQLTAADVNGDGRPDIITDNVDVLLANGPPNLGTFQPAVRYETGGNSVVVGHFNADARPDIATTSGDNIAVLLAGGSPGTFLSPTFFPGLLSGYHLIAADFNSDGRTDLVASGFNADRSRNNVQVFTSPRPPAAHDGTFTPGAGAHLVQYTNGIGSADVNADGAPDLVVGANWDLAFSGNPTGAAYILLASDIPGDDAFEAAVPLSVQTYLFGNQTWDQVVLGVAMADFNLDGRPDLLTSTYPGFSVLLNNTSQPAALVTHPASRTNAPGTVANFSVSALGTGPLAYQWRRNGVNLVNSGTVLGATTPTLTYLATASDNASIFDCLVTNACGTVQSNPASLAIAGVSPFAPMITSQSPSQVVPTGNAAAYTVAGTNFVGSTFQWRRDGVNLTNGGRFSGVTTATLNINPVLISDNGAAFDCLVSNSFGSARSNPAGLGVTESCPADFNNSGGTDVPDIFLFLAEWFQGCP